MNGEGGDGRRDGGMPTGPPGTSRPQVVAVSEHKRRGTRVVHDRKDGGWAIAAGNRFLDDDTNEDADGVSDLPPSPGGSAGSEHPDNRIAIDTLHRALAV